MTKPFQILGPPCSQLRSSFAFLTLLIRASLVNFCRLNAHLTYKIEIMISILSVFTHNWWISRMVVMEQAIFPLLLCSRYWQAEVEQSYCSRVNGLCDNDGLYQFLYMLLDLANPKQHLAINGTCYGCAPIGHFSHIFKQ